MDMNERLEIVNRMVANGYHLMNHTAEEWAGMFDKDTLLRFEENFMAWKKAQA